MRIEKNPSASKPQPPAASPAPRPAPAPAPPATPAVAADGFDTPRAGPATAVAAQLPARLRADGLAVLNTAPAQRLTVNGVGIDVHGATPQELAIIQGTLSRLPASHLRTIPRIVVAESIAHGSKRTGGATISQGAVDQYERSNPRNTAAYQAAGWQNLPRLELSRESLSRPHVQRRGVSETILHETGHHVDRAFRLSGRLSSEDLGSVHYGGTNREAGTGGGVYERFADAYMHHYLGSLGGDPVASRTVQRALERVEQRAAQAAAAP